MSGSRTAFSGNGDIPVVSGAPKVFGKCSQGGNFGDFVQGLELNQRSWIFHDSQSPSVPIPGNVEALGRAGTIPKVSVPIPDPSLGISRDSQPLPKFLGPGTSIGKIPALGKGFIEGKKALECCGILGDGAEIPWISREYFQALRSWLSTGIGADPCPCQDTRMQHLGSRTSGIFHGFSRCQKKTFSR